VSEAAIAERLAKGRAVGDFPANLSTQDFARYLAGVMNGMSIQARDGASLEKLRVLARTALAVLPSEGQNQGA
jgi:TetR/AcrR family transcriptional regulator, copper-responsive repressor